MTALQRETYIQRQKKIKQMLLPYYFSMVKLIASTDGCFYSPSALCHVNFSAKRLATSLYDRISTGGKILSAELSHSVTFTTKERDTVISALNQCGFSKLAEKVSDVECHVEEWCDMDNLTKNLSKLPPNIW